MLSSWTMALVLILGMSLDVHPTISLNLRNMARKASTYACECATLIFTIFLGPSNSTSFKSSMGGKVTLVFYLILICLSRQCFPHISTP